MRCAALLIVAVWAVGAATAQSVTPQPGVLTVFRYGVSTFPRDRVFAGDPAGPTLPFHWLFYLYQTPDRTLLIDSGFQDAAMARAFGVVVEDPVALLERWGVSAAQVTDIVVTHGHFDHIGTVHRFPNATIWVERGAWKNSLIQKLPTELMAFLQSSSRVRLIDGSQSIGDGVRLELVGGHAPGSSAVWIEREGKRPVLLMGDEAYRDENWREAKASGSTASRRANQAFLDRVAAEWKQNPFVVLTFHDPRVLPIGAETRGVPARVVSMDP